MFLYRAIQSQLISGGGLTSITALNSQGSPNIKSQAKVVLALLGEKS
jgi:hypothetical protein